MNYRNVSGTMEAMKSFVQGATNDQDMVCVSQPSCTNSAHDIIKLKIDTVCRTYFSSAQRPQGPAIAIAKVYKRQQQLLVICHKRLKCAILYSSTLQTTVLYYNSYIRGRGQCIVNSHGRTTCNSPPSAP